jgi:hypothetical protein
MNPNSAGKKRLQAYVGAGAAILVVLLVVHFQFAPFGYLAVRAACADEGGLRIEKRVKANGYWHGKEGWAGVPMAECGSCAEQIARGDFLFVDAELLDPLTKRSKGYFRFQLAPMGSDSCYTGQQFISPPEGTCVATTQLGSPPTKGYKFESNVIHRSDYFGVKLFEQRRQIIDVGSKRVLARHSNFFYATAAERYGRFSPSYMCEFAKDPFYGESDLLTEVLRPADSVAEVNGRQRMQTIFEPYQSSTFRQQ